MASTSNDGRTTPKDQNGPPSRTQPAYSSPIKAAPVMTDRHKRDEWSKHIHPHVHTEITEDEMIKKLFPTDNSENKAPSTRKNKLLQMQMGATPLPGSKKNGLKNLDYCIYLNALSEFVRYTSKDNYTIEFHTMEHQQPKGHATGTLSRPDIVGVRHSPGQDVNIKNLYWSQFEATVGVYSEKSEPLSQEAAYTLYHLQARPDLVSVVGIYVSERSFAIFFSNACRVLRTKRIGWQASKARPLLWACMWRLYNPDVDPSIQIDLERVPPQFRIKSEDGGKHDELVIQRVGESVGRRTIVMGNDKTGSVIKEQYLEAGRRFKEGPILKKIHKDGRFPGVVRLDTYDSEIEDPRTGSRIECQYKPPANGDTVTRFKTRLVMKDKGSLLTGEATPRSFLMGMYDLLEISRMLYRKCKILHRDISPENVLVSTEPMRYGDQPDDLRKDLDDVYFSAYLLHDSGDQGTTSPDRLETRTILIDFDCSEDQEPDEPVDGGIRARTGTPIFMARIVRSNRYPSGFYKLPSMPSINQILERRYPEDRLKTFPANDSEIIEIPENCTIPGKEFKHLLRYDAESVYWCILWWCIQAQPTNHKPGSAEEKISPTNWSCLTGQDDARDDRYVKGCPTRCLHSSYSKLEKLLKEMASHLKGDPSFTQKGNRDNPEYLHEAFQRIILNFLVTNASEGFLTLEKSPIPRTVEESAMNRTGSRSTHPLSTTLSETRSSKVHEPTASEVSPSSEVEVSHQTRSKGSKSAQKRTHKGDSERPSKKGKHK